MGGRKKKGERREKGEEKREKREEKGIRKRRGTVEYLNRLFGGQNITNLIFFPSPPKKVQNSFF